MPLAQVVGARAVLLAAGLAACAGPAAVVDTIFEPPAPREQPAQPPEPEPSQSADQGPRMPREVRTGAADMAIGRVEAAVSRDEVLQAVQAMVSAAPVCFSWPGIWLDPPNNRRNVYIVRYDLMSRDWGADVTATNQARMQELVDIGFLVRRERPDLGAGVVEYTLTSEGVAYLRGSPFGGERPTFCAPSQRRVVEITAMEWGQYPCGNLRVRFTHVADGWPAWARTQSARTRFAAAYGDVGVPAEGQVTLGRQWFRQGQLPSGRVNGALRSLCYDAATREVAGDDLNLSPPP